MRSAKHGCGQSLARCIPLSQCLEEGQERCFHAGLDGTPLRYAAVGGVERGGRAAPLPSSWRAVTAGTHVTRRPTAFTVEIAAAKKRKGKGRCERVRDRPPYASVQHTSEYDRRFGGRLLHGLCGDGSCALRRGFQPLTFSSRSHADRCAAHSGAVAAACSRGCLHFLRENCINSFIS